MKYREACQLSQEPLGDAEQVQDGALLEHGDVLRACACEHSVGRDSHDHHHCQNHHLLHILTSYTLEFDILFLVHGAKFGILGEDSKGIFLKRHS